MFDGLSRSLEKAWDSVRKDGKLTADNIKTPMREIRRALLEADVSTAPAMQEGLCHAGWAMCRGVQTLQAVLRAALCIPGCCRPQLHVTALAVPLHKVPMCNADRPALQVSLPVALDSMKCRVRCRVLHILNTCQATQ